MRTWAKSKTPQVDIDAEHETFCDYWRAHGKAMADWDRFNRKVSRGPRCHLWLAAKDTDGYGKFYLERRIFKAHRAAWYFAFGMPEQYEVMHTCDTPACVNPAHLRVGTHKENIDDMVQKRRHASANQRGANNPNARLTQEDIHEIRAWDATCRYLGRIYNVHYSVISKIKSGATWRE